MIKTVGQEGDRVLQLHRACITSTGSFYYTHTQGRCRTHTQDVGHTHTQSPGTAGGCRVRTKPTASTLLQHPAPAEGPLRHRPDSLPSHGASHKAGVPSAYHVRTGPVGGRAEHWEPLGPRDRPKATALSCDREPGDAALACGWEEWGGES